MLKHPVAWYAAVVLAACGLGFVLVTSPPFLPRAKVVVKATIKHILPYAREKGVRR